MKKTELPDQSGKQLRLAVRARNTSITLLALIIILVTVVAALVLASVNDDNARNLVRSYSIETAEKFHSYISRDLVLVQKAAKSTAVTEWFADEKNTEKKLAAYNEVMDYIGLLQNAMLYFGIEEPQRNQYFIPKGIPFEDFVPNERATLDPDNPTDAWYFSCLSLGTTNEYVLNIDIADGTDLWQLWINHNVYKDGKTTGVFCSGLLVDSILNEMFGQYDNNTIKGYLINNSGVIIMDSTFSNEYGIKNINNELTDSAFTSVMTTYLDGIDVFFDRQAQPEVVKLSGGMFGYASVAPITNSNWSIVVFYNDNFLSGFNNIIKVLPLPFALLAALLLYVIIQNTFMKRYIFNPIFNLTESVLKTKTNDIDIYGIDRKDEIGELARSANEAFNSLVHRKKMSDTLNNTAIKFLSENEGTFKDKMAEGVKLIVEAADVDRMSVWRNFDMLDGLHVEQIYRWDKKSGGSTEPTTALQDLPYSKLAPRWESHLKEGKMINGPVRLLEEAHTLKSFGVRSAFVTPVFINNDFWGFVLFEDLHSERYFDGDLVDIMRSTAFLCVNTVIRDEQDAKMHEAYERTQILLDATPLGANLWDKNCKIFDCNEESVKLFGVKDKKEYVDHFFKLSPEFQPDGQPSYEKAIAFISQAFREGRHVCEWMHQMPDGSLMPAEVTLVRVPYGDEFAVAGYTRDLRDHNKMMDEIAKRDSLLTAALDEAKNASLAKSNFLSNMSHEIRTPMNAIIGMTRIAAKTEDVEKLKYCLSNIESSSTHLLGLINDILDISKIEAGKFELDHTPLNIEKMLIKVCGLITEKIEQKNIKYNVILGTNMRMRYIGDELRLAQVITNLLSNAVKFTPDGGMIELTAIETRIEANYSILRFSVKDTGIGMTEEQVSRLFRAFEQADSGTTRKFGGTGLGLAISKSIVEKMDGRIWVESVPNEGSKFIFEIKLERPEQQRGAVLFGSIRPSDIKILIVDPDTDARIGLKTILSGFGMVADEVENAAQAVNLAIKARETGNPYDIVFVDCILADNEGIDFIKNSSFIIDKNNVVLITTFLNWTKIEEELRDIGIRKFIPKPLFPSSILDSINEILSGAAKNLDIVTEKSDEGPDFSNISLLLAEDVEINREIFIALLEDTKIKIDVAENGLVTVKKFKENSEKYDIIIMDVQMPEMDGYEATKSIRAIDTEKANSIPIVAMTANVFKEDIEKCLAAGMNDHLPKPIVLDSVLEKIRLYCGNKIN